MSSTTSGSQRYLRACMVCSIVQSQTVSISQASRCIQTPYETEAKLLSHQSFMRDGCPNCESFLGLINSSEAVQECTSQVFEGLITLSDPTNSWVARWQRLDGCVGGVYAVKVVGTVRLLVP